MRELKITTSNEIDNLPYPENLGKRSKFGGAPEWIQQDETPICLNCNTKMTFVVQIDSIDYSGDIKPKEEYMFGDVGILYNFFCFECHFAKVIFQEY